MNQSETNAVKPAKAVAAKATGVPSLKQSLFIIAGTGVIGVLIGLLPRFN